MSVFGWVVLGVIALILYVLYAGVILKKNKVNEAMSGIDVQLKKRYDLIPNMMNMAAKYMEHEKNLMAEITKLRTNAMSSSFRADPKAKIENESLLEAKLKEFNISLENYPDMKSNQAMLETMQSLQSVEEHIAAARRFYNSAVNDLVNATEIFPSSVMAKMLGIKADMPYFEASEEEKKSINSADYFK